MNAGKDVHTLMREVVLPPELEVGQGYGMVRWNVRAIWENYAGWFHHRSTAELYAEGPDRMEADLLELAGAEPVLERARSLLDAGEPVRAIQLAEIVHRAEPDNKEAKQVLITAHENLLSGQHQLLGSRLAARADQGTVMTNRVQFDFTGATALVTGGTSGIGHATASLLRDSGAHVTDHRHQSRHRRTTTSICRDWSIGNWR